MKIRRLILLLFAAVPLTLHATQNARSDDWQTLNEDLLFPAGAFVVEEGSGLALASSGLTLSDGANSGTYTSPAVEAPFPFNALVPQWLAELPPSTGMELRLRTGSSADDLGPWQEIHPANDWMVPDEQAITGEMAFVPAADGRHSTAQFQITLNRDDDSVTALLRELRLTFIDSTAGPTTAELIEMQKAMDEQQAANQPAVAEAVDGYPKAICAQPRRLVQRSAL